jgi:hypothetical protein
MGWLVADMTLWIVSLESANLAHTFFLLLPAMLV